MNNLYTKNDFLKNYELINNTISKEYKNINLYNKEKTRIIKYNNEKQTKIINFILNTDIINQSKDFCIPTSVITEKVDPSKIVDIFFDRRLKKIKPLDLPFKTIFFNWYGFKPLPYSDNEFGILYIKSMFIREISYGIYDFLFDVDHKGQINSVLHRINVNKMKSPNDFYNMSTFSCYAYAKKICNIINSCPSNLKQVINIENNTATETGNKLYSQPIRDVIFIKMNPEDEPSTYFPNCKVHAKCPYQYEVRGHWRKLDGFNKIGKNRDDEYVVEGYTWVSEHIRGDENGVLIKKQRVLINN